MRALHSHLVWGFLNTCRACGFAKESEKQNATVRREIVRYGILHIHPSNTEASIESQLADRLIWGGGKQVT